MKTRARAAFGVTAVALASLALWAGVVALTGGQPAGAAGTLAGAASLSAGVSTHSPCGDPIWLMARLKDGTGHGVKGVKVRFSFKLKSGAVRRQATTGSRGVARIQMTPAPDTAPQGVRVNVRAKTVYRGATLTAATWFTPKYT